MLLQKADLDRAAGEVAERVLVLAPKGRDAVVASGILAEGALSPHVCHSFVELVREIRTGADVALLTEESARHADARELIEWVGKQPAWSDFPFVILTRHGGGVERNPTAAHFVRNLGNVTFLERPFHP